MLQRLRICLLFVCRIKNKAVFWVEVRIFGLLETSRRFPMSACSDPGWIDVSNRSLQVPPFEWGTDDCLNGSRYLAAPSSFFATFLRVFPPPKRSYGTSTFRHSDLTSWHFSEIDRVTRCRSSNISSSSSSNRTTEE